MQHNDEIKEKRKNLMRKLYNEESQFEGVSFRVFIYNLDVSYQEYQNDITDLNAALEVIDQYLENSDRWRYVPGSVNGTNRICYEEIPATPCDTPLRQIHLHSAVIEGDSFLNYLGQLKQIIVQLLESKTDEEPEK